jgi:SAM-dependent methyltransferase
LPLPDPVFPGKAGLYLSMMHYGLFHNRDFAREHHAFFEKMTSYLGGFESRRVLDVGCGKSFWLTLLLANHGAKVTGIDTEVVKPGFSKDKYLELAKKNGYERATRTFIWDQVFAKSYYKELENLNKTPLDFEKVDLKAMSGVDLDFPDNTFDIVVSHEVFEHIADVSSTLKGLQRVMKPQGKTYIYIHNFTSLSGGHHIAWKYPDAEPSRKVPPWDHLRENKYSDIPSWLNRLREHEYRTEFEKYFEIIDWLPTDREGETLLTDRIAKELSDYSEDELLTKGFTVVAVPKK